MVERSPGVPDLVKITEVFLIPSSFLVAALGTADTNAHRAAVSLLALLVSILWGYCSFEAYTEFVTANQLENESMRYRRLQVMFWLPILFGAGWFVSLLVHCLLWNQPLGANWIKG
jgi:hypothetical protein